MAQQPEEQQLQNLHDFSDELLLKIFMDCTTSAKTITTLSLVCKKFNRLAEDQHLWHQLNLDTFGGSVTPPLQDSQQLSQSGSWTISNFFKKEPDKKQLQKDFFKNKYQELRASTLRFSLLGRAKERYSILSDDLIILEEKNPPEIPSFVTKNKQHFLDLSFTECYNLTKLLLEKQAINAWRALTNDHEIGSRMFGFHPEDLKKVNFKFFPLIVEMIQHAPEFISACMGWCDIRLKKIESQHFFNIKENTLELLNSSNLFQISKYDLAKFSLITVGIMLRFVKQSSEQVVLAAELLKRTNDRRPHIEGLITCYSTLIDEIAISTTPNIACEIAIALKNYGWKAMLMQLTTKFVQKFPNYVDMLLSHNVLDPNYIIRGAYQKSCGELVLEQGLQELDTLGFNSFLSDNFSYNEITAILNKQSVNVNNNALTSNENNFNIKENQTMTSSITDEMVDAKQIEIDDLKRQITMLKEPVLKQQEHIQALQKQPSKPWIYQQNATDKDSSNNNFFSNTRM